MIRYIDLDPGELMHWKYIKRVKLSNGKYRYYYDESELHKSKKAADKYTVLGLRSAAEAANAKSRGEFTNKKDEYLKAEADAEMHIKIGQKYLDAAEKMTQKYNMEKIISLPERIISKGIVAVANIFENLKKPKIDYKRAIGKNNPSRKASNK